MNSLTNKYKKKASTTRIGLIHKNNANLYFSCYFRWRKILERTTCALIDIYYVLGYGKNIDGSCACRQLILKAQDCFLRLLAEDPSYPG